MKSIRILIAALALLLLVPVSSYAIVDFGAYGGYSFANIDTGAKQDDIRGWEYGAFAHLNTGLPMLFTVGIGGFYQANSSTLEVNKKDIDVSRNMYGIDAMFTLELPLLPVNPFARAGIAINESYELKLPGSKAEDKKFKAYFFALGAGYKVFPMTSLFLEYMYTMSDRDNDVTINTHSVHIGAMINIGI